MRWLVPLLILSCASPALAKSKPAPAPAGPPNVQMIYQQLLRQTEAAYDSAAGGFVKKGQPAESAVELAFLVARDQPNEAWKSRALQTVDWTRGLLDTIGGGFVATAEQADPNVPKLEKPTGANARRLDNLIDALDATGDARYRKDGERAVDFFERVLLDARGGFVTDQVGDRDLQPAANGVAIRAYLRWAGVTRDRRYLNFALKSVDRVWKSCWDERGALLRHGTFDEILQYPQLLDQAEMGRALVLAYQLGGRSIDLQRARQLGDVLLTGFQDERGGFRTQWAVSKKGETKKAARVGDENAVAMRFLGELSALTNDPKYRAAAERAWAAFAEDLVKAKLDAADWALAARADFAPATPQAPDWQVVESVPTTTQPRSMSFKQPRRR